MKKIAGIIVSTLLILATFTAFRPVKQKPTELYRKYLLEEVDQIMIQLDKMILHLSDSKKMQDAYWKAREHYKHIELFVEHTSPRESKYFINGPLVLKHDPEY